MLLFAEEVILTEEKTSTEDKIKIMEGGFYKILLEMYNNVILFYVAFK